MTYPKQRGSALIISLIMLVILMLLGVMAMNAADTSYRLAGNVQFQAQALNDAEKKLVTMENGFRDGTYNATNLPAGSSFKSTRNSLTGEDIVGGLPGSSACSKVDTYAMQITGSGGRGATRTIESYYSVLIPSNLC